MIDDEDDVAIAAITVAELQLGIELSKGRTRIGRQQFLDGIIASIPVLNYDLAVAQAHAELLGTVRKQGRPRGAHDLIIAATSRSSKRSLVTADKTGFIGLPGVTVVVSR